METAFLVSKFVIGIKTQWKWDKKMLFFITDASEFRPLGQGQNLLYINVYLGKLLSESIHFEL